MRDITNDIEQRLIEINAEIERLSRERNGLQIALDHEKRHWELVKTQSEGKIIPNSDLIISYDDILQCLNGDSKTKEELKRDLHEKGFYGENLGRAIHTCLWAMKRKGLVDVAGIRWGKVHSN